MVFDIATNANKIAANRAIADPLPAPISDEIYRPPSNEVIPKIFQESASLDITIRSLTLKQPTLDDVFISYTGHDLRDETENKKYSRRKEFNLNRRKGL